MVIDIVNTIVTVNLLIIVNTIATVTITDTMLILLLSCRWLLKLKLLSLQPKYQTTNVKSKA